MTSIEWIVASIGIAALLAVVGFWRTLRDKTSGSQPRDNSLATLATSLVVLGIVFSTERLIGYSFIGAGVLLSLATLIKSRTKSRI